MRYGDLIQFEPIESVVQLLDANRSDEAKKLVSTYVISDDMAERIASLIVPQLSFDGSVDHKGILVVGNYGTGKSHLMSVLSLLAEDAVYLPMIRHPQVAGAASAIAGRFKVHRIEISSEMSLRDIVTGELEMFLRDIDVDFSFPAANTVVNNKAAFEQMMAAFAETYPDYGVLLVVDEFLDYLRSRRDHDLVLDLSFLREIGEIAKHLRFRFVAGVQEAVFDSSRFQHVADSLRRVKERFTEVRLARQDVSFVVAERLLRKSADQQDKIRRYLTPFARFYGAMNERMDEYVRLFPVHPDYLRTFERIGFAEKRNALETLSLTMRAILDKDVPADRPGLITYDHYWETVQGNSVFRSDPSVKDVMRVSELIESRVRQAFARPTYKPMAIKIIHALSVHRLTTGGDIHVPIGPTAEELRDTLCVYQPGIEDLGGEPASDLLSQVETVLREIVKTVNGQFISKAANSEQYYLDLKKDIDYDAQIEKRAESLDHSALDRAFYGAIKQLMEQTDETVYVSGHRIWQYQIEWQEHRVERDGYLFFGAPNDRPTAQPDRDFYVYFIQPFEPPRFRDENHPDEVFFRLKGADADLKRQLAFYAAAVELAAVASGGARSIYQSKAQESLRAMSKWLQEKQMIAFEVTYQGASRPLQDWLGGVALREKARLGPEERINFRDVVNVAAGIALSRRFADVAPEYPNFAVLITERNRKDIVRRALRMLTVGDRSKDAVAVLDALEMLDGDRVDPARSRYARDILSRLKAKGHGQVLNRAELLAGPVGVEYYSPDRFRLEPDLLIVVLAGLVYAGEIVLVITGDKLDAGKLARFAQLSLDELISFRHVEAPKEINVSVLRSLFELLALPPGLAHRVTQGETDSVVQLQDAIGKLVQRVLKAATDLQNRLALWGQPLLREDEANDFHARLGSLKGFAESLSPYNTIGKLKHLKVNADDIANQIRNMEALAAIEQLLNVVAELGTTAAYLSQAQMVLPNDDAWVKQAHEVRSQVLAGLAQNRGADYRAQLAELKREYIRAYIALHSRARLGRPEDQNKTTLMKDPRLATLDKLAGIALMPAGQLGMFKERLAALKSCFALTERELTVTPICPHCAFRPAQETLPIGAPANVLSQLDTELDALVEGWQRTLLGNLSDPVIREKLDLLKVRERKLIEGFVAAGKLPDPIKPDFIGALQEAFSGLVKEIVTSPEVRNALLAGGSPATAEELRRRFDELIAKRSRGKDSTKLRFIVE